MYLINRLPTVVLKGKSPFEVLYSKVPDYKFLKVFGVACFPCIRPYQSHKFEFHSIKCVNLGYSEVHKGYKCLSPHGRIYITRHVIFNENEFPFTTGFLNTHQPEQFVTLNTPHSWFTLPSVSPDPQPTPILPTTSVPETAASPLLHSSPQQSTSDAYSRSGSPIAYLGDEFEDCQNAIPPAASTDLSPPLTSLQPTHPMITRGKVGIFKPKTFVGESRFNCSVSEPLTVEIALQHEGWHKAMVEELDALHRNQTWTLVPATDKQNIVGCKWVYKAKYNSDGSFQRYKAHLVAKGFHQCAGLDFGETFSLVAKASTVRVVLTLAVTHNWEIRQIDINDAFLNGVLDEDVFMAQPPGFINDKKPGYVCRLHKSIYGLKQAPRAWYEQLKQL